MDTKVESGQKKRQLWKTEQKVKAYVEKYHMIQQGENIVVGVSGGADSVCLLRIMGKLKEEWNISIQAVHVHHQLRGTEADEDEQFVRRLCEKERVSCHCFHEDVRRIAVEEKIGLEEAGRHVRYRCFERVCKEIGGGKIALAHHQDDLAETMLHHLVRGTGMSGMYSMKPVSGNRIRPILCLEKEEILEYLEAAGQSYRTDSSNLEDDYTRNRIRHHVLRELKQEVNAQAVKHMAQFSQDMAEMGAVLEQAVKEKRTKYVRIQEDGIFLEEGLKREQGLIVRQMILGLLKEFSGKQKDFTRVHVEAVVALWHSQVGARRELPYGLQARRTYEGIVLEKKEVRKRKAQAEEQKEKAPVYFTVQVDTNGEKKGMQAGELMLETCLLSGDFGKIPEKKYTKWLDYDRIKQTLVIRHRQPGDRICLYEKGGSKKLKDYLIDRKIPAMQRDQLWLLADGPDILWIIGDRISAAYKVTGKSQRILQVKIKGGSTHE